MRFEGEALEKGVVSTTRSFSDDPIGNDPRWTGGASPFAVTEGEPGIYT